MKKGRALIPVKRGAYSLGVPQENNIPIGRLEELTGAAFQTNFWKEAGFRYHVLETAHRQSDQVQPASPHNPQPTAQTRLQRRMVYSDSCTLSPVR